jgi:hypothetical protein
MLSVVILSVVILNLVLMSVIILNVVMLSVVAPDATWQQKLATDISQFALKVVSSTLDLP